jgi:hypothetical protein
MWHKILNGNGTEFRKRKKFVAWMDTYHSAAMDIP